MYGPLKAVEFAFETTFERRWSASPAYFVGVQRL